MTRTRSSRGRRRNRNRPGEDATQQQEQIGKQSPAVGADAQPQPHVEPAPPNGEPSAAPQESQQRRRRPAGEGQQQRSHRGGRQSFDSQGGRDRGNRRRQGRRPLTPPSSTQVLKPRAPSSGLHEPLAKRDRAEMRAPDGPALGCPMLSRTSLGMPFAQGRKVPRCALGWAVHSESEAALCLETPDPFQCWKVHTERIDEIRAKLDERAAD